jgi:hypothetical protein
LWSRIPERQFPDWYTLVLASVDLFQLKRQIADHLTSKFDSIRISLFDIDGLFAISWGHCGLYSLTTEMISRTCVTTKWRVP